MNIVEVEKLTKVYDERRVVDGVSFTIKEGEVFGLLGPNGAGKTTTVSMLSCLIPPTSGDAFIDGKSIVKEPMEVKKRIGIVPQEIALYPTLSALENLFFFGEMYGLRGRRLKKRVYDVLEIVGLKKRAKDPIYKYSGGMKRRINIAIGLLPSPKLLMLDEPTVGVDPQSRTNILETLKELNREGISILYTSHYMEEVEFLCDRVAIMDMGKIVALGTKDDLKNLVGEMDSVEISTIDEPGEIEEDLKKLEGVDRVKVREKMVEVLSMNGRKILPKVLEFFNKKNIRVKEIEIREPNLETVFLHLTGRELRD